MIGAVAGSSVLLLDIVFGVAVKRCATAWLLTIDTLLVIVKKAGLNMGITVKEKKCFQAMFVFHLQCIRGQ